MKRYKKVATYDFNPDQHEWLSSIEGQNTIVPQHVSGPILFSVTGCLDHDGVYRGHSVVNCYEFREKRSRPRMKPNDAS